MKLLAVLFAMYMVTLSCVPCLCDDACETEATEQSSQPGKQQDESCTPFCSCACCHTVVISIKPVPAEKASLVILSKENTAPTNQSYTSYNSHTIWQPPRA